MKYRKGIGIFLINSENKLWVGKRIDNKNNYWQMPQGGVDEYETEEQAMKREMFEEVGINNSFEILGMSKNLLFYDLPKEIIKFVWNGKYIGQSQRWFFCKFIGIDSMFDLEKDDNPELLKAKDIGLKIYSYPEFIFNQSKDKIRIVIGGSHGKTSITSIILHVLSTQNIEVDYMVGAQLDGFEVMVKLTESNKFIILEGDEYLSSALDLRPKFHLYKPHIALLSGIAWDHINVFKTFNTYINQFKIFGKQIKGFMGIGSAPEFLENLMWKKFTKRMKEITKTKGLIFLKHGKYEYPITLQLIKDGKKNKVLNKKIDSSIYITMIHGQNDEVVPVVFSRYVLRLFKKAPLGAFFYLILSSLIFRVMVFRPIPKIFAASIFLFLVYPFLLCILQHILILMELVLLDG